MLAKIVKEDNQTYVTNVVAIKYIGWDSIVFAVDESKTNIVCLKYWRTSGTIKRKIFPLKNIKDNWIIDGQWEGFDWLINNKTVMEKLEDGLIKKSLPVSVTDFPQLKNFALKSEIEEWQELKTKNDIDVLMDCSFGFHDGTIESIESENEILFVKFNTWSSQIILKCQGVIYCNLKDFENLDYIFESEINIVDDVFEWSADNIWHLKAKQIEWKLIITN